uniref:Non-lysosomal glucosylceramidase n=1 Tax=Setaria digitata TaxID=48799 RepID=A0A915PQZ1_9BILA
MCFSVLLKMFAIDCLSGSLTCRPNVAACEECKQTYGWFARGDKIPDEIRVPFNRPSFRHIYELLPFLRRYFLFWFKNIGRKETLPINLIEPLTHKPFYGVPCGTIGSGSIGRDFRGGFCKFGLRPGLIEQKTGVVKANQFILTLRQKNETNLWRTVYQKVLCACPSLSSGQKELVSWDFSFPPDKLTYRGLYPRSWTSYSIPEFNFTLCMRQISPIIPNDYKDSSLPVTLFIFDADNQSGVDLQVAITFTFRNGTGCQKWSNESICKASIFEENTGSSIVKGVYLRHTIDDMKCTYSIGVLVHDALHVSCCTGFDPCGTGEDVWIPLLVKENFQKKNENMDQRQLGIAVLAEVLVKANTKIASCFEYALVWDMPVVHFGGRERKYKRRYTRFFGDQGCVAPTICAYSLGKYREWERKIEEWQHPVIAHPHLPDWYKSALFNELYYITDGGSVWFEYDSNWNAKEKHLSVYTTDLMKQYGRFAYLESWEYRMLNTYDVHFYASFALAQLWPNLEHVLQAEMTDQVDLSDEHVAYYQMDGSRGFVKHPSRVPHDLGNPAVEPWLCTNAYVVHDTGKWKDLNLKFILTFLQKVWPTIKRLVTEAQVCWDEDDDGMIENSGTADQTYDAWKMNGVSAYCGCLWLASLQAAASLANEIGDIKGADLYTKLLSKARDVFERKLWNGEYYNFDEKSESAKTIMADQLCGNWFLMSVSPEIAHNLLPLSHVKSALDKIYNLNVLNFASGRLGAVNGMKKDGTVERQRLQADEMWIGVTYALAASFMQQGDIQRGFDTAWGCYDACYNRFGLQYQTPEAVYENHFYRAIGYMRPLSIWSIQWTLLRQLKVFELGSTILNHIHTGTPLEFQKISPSKMKKDEHCVKVKSGTSSHF